MTSILGYEWMGAGQSKEVPTGMPAGLRKDMSTHNKEVTDNG